ncbi:MAG TPA: HD domain-containing protein [Candidatus Dojkabacteria bacterium]|nr:HD domain-containing protein [Candidatus Dojkabacteria bacterium]
MEKQTSTGVLKSRLYSLAPLNFIKDLKEAVSYAEEKYKGKTRFNGVPMINHVLEIAISLLEKGLDLNTTIATLLHEIELNETIEEEIHKYFSDDVMEILNGIKKIKRGTDSVDTNPEIIIKYVLNVSKDLRPLYLKIYDTLHDIRSFDEIPDEQKKSKLFKALNIYGVLAEYLYLEDLKKELEEKAFSYYLPIEYRSISKKMESLGISEELLEKYKKEILLRIRESRIKARIEQRIKSKYSIYKKLKKYEKEWIDPNISRLDDLIAFRIITSDIDSCYEILEKLMDKGEIIEERFDDYISNPKPNGYKAIQFPICFPQISKMNIELQIVTEDMYKENTFGKASHIAYKASQLRYAKPTNKYDWVKKIQDEIEKSKIENKKSKSFPIRCKIFDDEVFVFTPKGKIIALDKGDTVLDFAFRLHTDIGNKAESAKVNGLPAKLAQKLVTGDTVEIKVNKNKSYQKDTTLEYANSRSTKNKIRKNMKERVK